MVYVVMVYVVIIGMVLLTMAVLDDLDNLDDPWMRSRRHRKLRR